MNNLVSVCIPTYNRPSLLTEAIVSCLDQTYRPLELLVGDDSQDNASAELINTFRLDNGIALRYRQNRPPLGQAGNVNDLFSRASGDRIVLLHDDDLLLPDAIEALSNCWISHPNLTAAFGKQYFISATGKVSESESECANKAFFRTPAHAGLQKSALASALVQQFPNDGFMIRSDVAKRVRLRERGEVGDAPDFDFGIRVAFENSEFYFLDKYTCKYRHTPNSLAHSAQTVEYMFPQIEKLKIPAEIEPARKAALQRMAPFYVRYLALKKRRAEALRVLFSENFEHRLRYSRKGLILLGQIVFPGLDPMLQKIRQQIGAGSRSN